ncbi:cell division protein [Legionella antarctica]|uniref:Cell division protein n=1 Tax=Legionella antarctica TaxID=2708020 RepID=A0A6F8T895_9GAMM|nr:cellulose biosynthesis protein BcsQ [Legionella antarctica]BCA96671.1 cell division protein [Legionella antarctica]
MPVIALQGIRGGTGTTSITAGLAWALQSLGESVLVIDFSPDNLLRLYFNMSFKQPRGWAQGLMNNVPWQENAMRYTRLLDFIPFGHTSKSDLLQLDAKFRAEPDFWQLNIAQLIATRNYNWILLDLPAANTVLAQSGLALADHIICLLNPDVACHVRLHQQDLAERCYFLMNKYTSSNQLQQDLVQLWQHTVPDLLPIMIHLDEAVAEALAVKQPIGEYSTHSLATKELGVFANWCLTQFTAEHHE